MKAKLIAKNVACDLIRDMTTTAEVYEEELKLGPLYTVRVETSYGYSDVAGDLYFREFDDMGEALRAAYDAAGPVMPTNGNVPTYRI